MTVEAQWDRKPGNADWVKAAASVLPDCTQANLLGATMRRIDLAEGSSDHHVGGVAAEGDHHS